MWVLLAGEVRYVGRWEMRCMSLFFPIRVLWKDKGLPADGVQLPVS
jgi:hypothetical protein